MNRFRINLIESLESKSLLSASPAGLAESVVVRPKVATTGTAIVLTYTEKNTSHHNISVTVGPEFGGFVVSQSGKTIWVSNAGIQPTFAMNQTLKPGQSLTLKATWDGRSNQDSPDGIESGSALTGKFTVSNELATGRALATITLRASRAGTGRGEAG